VSVSHSGFVNSRVLKFQVGYLLNESKGTHSDIEIDIPRVRVSEDVVLDYLKGTLRFSRTSRGILVQGTLSTQIHGECNRCLVETVVDLDIPVEEIFVYPPETGADLTVADDGILDMAPLLREEIILDTPLGVLCKPDCAGLCPECGQNLNEGTCDCQKETGDPRLAALRALKDRLSESK